MTRIFVLAQIVLCFSSSAEAGGLFRCRSRVCAPSYYAKPVVKRVVQPQQVINIATVYPQGQTQYSMTNPVQLYATNPSLAIEAAARVAERGTQSLEAAVKMAQQGNTEAAALAKVQAATLHLQAAVGQSQPQSLHLKITQGAGGIEVERLEGSKPSGKDSETPGAPASLLRQHCSKCHGTDLSDPKGQLYLDAGVSLEAGQAMRVLEVIAGRDVPEAMQPVIDGLSPEDRGLIVEEVLEAWRR